MNIAKLRAVYYVICSQDTQIHNDVIAKLYILCRDCLKRFGFDEIITTGKDDLIVKVLGLTSECHPQHQLDIKLNSKVIVYDVRTCTMWDVVKT